MPGYIIHELEKYNHPAPEKPQHAPYQWVTLVYGSREQKNPKKTSKSPLLNKDVTQYAQSIDGNFLHYGRAVDLYKLPDLREIASERANPTTDTAIKCNMLMDYLHNNPDAVIRYHVSDMILKIVSDAEFLVLPQA